MNGNVLTLIKVGIISLPIYKRGNSWIYIRVPSTYTISFFQVVHAGVRSSPKSIDIRSFLLLSPRFLRLFQLMIRLGPYTMLGNTHVLGAIPKM